MSNRQKIELRKVRDFGDVFTDTFTLIKHGKIPIGKSLLFLVFPFAALLSLPFAVYYMVLSTDPTSITRYITDQNYLNAFIGIMVIVVFIFFFVYILIESLLMLTAYSYMFLYQRKDPDEITFSELFSVMRKNFWRVYLRFLALWFFLFLFTMVLIILVSIIMGFSFAGGGSVLGIIFIPFMFLAFFSGIIYYMVSMSLVIPVSVFERKGFFASIRQSFSLLSGSWWLTFGIAAVFAIILYVLNVVFQLPNIILVSVLAAHMTEGGGSQTIKYIFFVTSIFQMASYLLYIFFWTAIGLQYFSCAEKKGGAGLMGRIEKITETE